MKKLLQLIIVTIIAFSACFSYNYFFSPKIAYVNTGKLMVGFSEASKIEKELKTEEDKWRAEAKTIEDSLQKTVNTMSSEYNKASAAKQKEMQDMLSARNQQLNNFKQANMRRIEKMRNEKMQGVYEKANIYFAEYGKKHRYSIILGTVAGGNILYGNENYYDITNELIKGLNERYK
jgi:outer membrane protein